MDLFRLAIMANICSMLIVVLVYLYLYILYRDRYIGIWVLSWGLQILRLAFFDIVGVSQLSNFHLLIYQFLSMCTVVLLFWGTYDFIGQPLKKWWLFVALTATAVSDSAIIYDLSPIMKALPTAWLISVMYIWTGVVLIRNLQIAGMGKYMTGGAFILLGAHNLNYPFVITFPTILPWAFLIGVIVRIIIAVGTLIIYFEKTRMDIFNKEEYYGSMTENVADVIHRYTPQPAVEYISPTITNITGYTPTEYYTDPSEPVWD